MKTVKILFLIFPLIIIWWVYQSYFYLDMNSVSREGTKTIYIPKKANLDQIAGILNKEGLISHADAFKRTVIFFKYDRVLRAGRFSIPTGLSYPQLAKYLTVAKPQTQTVRLIEGWDNSSVFSELSEKYSLDSVRFDSLGSDPAFLARLNIEAGTIRGYLLPDTYFFETGMTEMQILEFLVQQNQNLFKADSVRLALKKSLMSIHQILTLASIIEGEAILDAERPQIAAVYYNRLKRGMLLQADPTIQFIVPGPPRRVLYKDLETDSPYNTYKYTGLPPGPINNPGRASILAAIFPVDSDNLYFVARGDGSHSFHRTLREHAAAKGKFDEYRRQVRKNQSKKRP